MNWEMLAFWNYYHWVAIVFVIVITLEMAVVLLLFSGKPKVRNQVNRVDTQRQEVRSPIRPFSIPSDRCSDTENNTKTNPQP